MPSVGVPLVGAAAAADADADAVVGRMQTTYPEGVALPNREGKEPLALRESHSQRAYARACRECTRVSVSMYASAVSACGFTWMCWSVGHEGC